MSVALNFCFPCNLGSLSQSSSILRKTCPAPNTANLSTIDLFVRIELVDFPKNRANRAAVFEGSLIRYNRGTLSRKASLSFPYAPIFRVIIGTVKTLNIGTPKPATVVVLNIKQFNFTMK